MKQTWNVAGLLSGHLDTDECRVFFAPPRVLPAALNVDLWGVVLHTSFQDWPTELKLHSPGFDTAIHDVYIAGLSRYIAGLNRLTIHNPDGGDILVTLYAPIECRPYSFSPD